MNWINLFKIPLLVLIISGCLSKKNDLIVGANVWPGYEPIFLSDYHGLFQGKAPKIISYPSASEVIQSFENKIINVAALTMDEVLLLAQKNIPLKVFLIADYSFGGDIIIGSPDIKNIRQLKGKRVGVETTALGSFMLTRSLELNGMSIGDVNIVPLEVHEHELAFKSKEIDAVVTFEPVKTKLLKLGGNNLFDSTKIPNEISDVIIVTEDLLKKNKEALVSFAKSWFQSLAKIQEKDDKSISFVSKREGLSKSDFLEALGGLHLISLKENLISLSQKDSSFLKGVNKLQEIMVKKKLLDKRIDLNKLITKEIITELEK